jgi:hypothetical protein
MYQCKACHEEVTMVQVPDAVGKGQHETSQCPNCGEDCEYGEVNPEMTWDIDDTVGTSDGSLRDPQDRRGSPRRIQTP